MMKNCDTAPSTHQSTGIECSNDLPDAEGKADLRTPKPTIQTTKNITHFVLTLIADAHYRPPNSIIERTSTPVAASINIPHWAGF